MTAPSETTSSGRVARVLVVEDHGDSASLLKLLLELEGYVARAATTAAEALHVADRLQPDAVVLDLGLPDASGYQVLEALRARPSGRDATIIAFTGRSGPEVTARCQEAGFDHHVCKSIDLVELLAVLPPPRG